MNRDNLIEKLEKMYPGMMLQPSEEFDGRKGGTWTSAENSPIDKQGLKLFNPYCEDYIEKNYRLDVRIPFADMLEEYGWYCEYIDAGTVMIYPI